MMLTISINRELNIIIYLVIILVQRPWVMPTIKNYPHLGNCFQDFLHLQYTEQFQYPNVILFFY